MAATFPCPHCGATYPFKPVLVGRAVRCTTCKQAFQLRPDGVADKVEIPEPAPPPPPPSAPAAPAAHANGASMLENGHKPAAKPAARGRGALNAEQEQERRNLAANLSGLAEAAAKTSAATQAEADARAEKKGSGSIRRGLRGGGGAAEEGRVGEIGPAIITGQGVREFRERLMLTGGVIGVIALIAAICWLASLKSDERRAVEAYAAPIYGVQARYPNAIPAIRARAWLPDQPALSDVGRISIAKGHGIPLGPAKDILAQLQGMTALGSPPVWAPLEQADEVRRLWDPKATVDANVAKLSKASVAVEKGKSVPLRVLAQKEIERQLDQIDSDARAALLGLITSPGGSAGDKVAERLRGGEVPDAIDIAPFTGRGGTLLIDQGRSYGHISVDYEGRLIRFHGAGWPAEWRVLDLRTSASGSR